MGEETLLGLMLRNMQATLARTKAILLERTMHVPSSSLVATSWALTSKLQGLTDKRRVACVFNSLRLVPWKATFLAKSGGYSLTSAGSPSSGILPFAAHRLPGPSS